MPTMSDTTAGVGPAAETGGGGAPGVEPSGDRLATLPNLITLVRLLCIPVFLYLLFVRDARLGAAILLGVLGATDWVDGYAARHLNQVSNFGKAFDPTVDRLLLIVGVVSIIVVDGCPLWFGLVVVAREVILSIWVVSIMALGAKRMDVTWWGKAGTFGLMTAFPLFLASHSTLSWHATAGVLAWVAGIPGLVLSYVAWATYVPIALTALREGRAARQAIPAPPDATSARG